jgi:hypothetical protein
MIESDFGSNFIENDGTNIYDILTKGWVTNLRQFLNYNRAELKRVDDECTRTKRNISDSFIMEDVCRLAQWSKVELLSDVTTADGTSIRQNIWKRSTDSTHEDLVKVFYQQPPPGEMAW